MSGKLLKELPEYSRVKVDTGVLVRNRPVIEFSFLFLDKEEACCITDEGVDFTLSPDLVVEFISTMKEYDLKRNM